MGYFLTLINKLSQTLIVGIGIHLSFSLGGILFLGFPTIVSVSAYALAISERAGLNPYIALLVAMAAALVVSLLFAYLFVKVSAESFSVLGLASIVAFEALARSWDGVTNGILGIGGIQRPEIFTNLPALVIGTILIAMLVLFLEGVLLQSKFGRALRAFKENPTILEVLGISHQKVSTILIILTGLIFSLGGILIVWQVQFLDPSFGGLTMLIEILTIGILTLKPQVKAVVIATLLVVLLPEILRFTSLPSNIFGHLRVFLYSLILIFLIIKFQNKLFISQRSI